MKKNQIVIDTQTQVLNALIKEFWDWFHMLDPYFWFFSWVEMEILEWQKGYQRNNQMF